MIDWYASLFPGLAAAPVAILEQALVEDLDRGRARLGNGRSSTARTAALINGTAAHAAEVDDSFRDAMYHPGAATIAAALAAAQDRSASGVEFLRGVVLGYEVSTRIGMVLGRPHYQFWHSTGTVGSFGAAAAVGGVLQMQGPALAHALATAATFAAGLQQAFRMDSMSKPLHAGRAAEAGLLAAQCAAAPLVLVLEDLQWGDLPTVHLVDTALRLLPDAPLFVLATARPEVTDLFPSLWAERDARTITLAGLTRKASEKLVRAALGEGAAVLPFARQTLDAEQRAISANAWPPGARSPRASNSFKR